MPANPAYRAQRVVLAPFGTRPSWYQKRRFDEILSRFSRGFVGFFINLPQRTFGPIRKTLEKIKVLRGEGRSKNAPLMKNDGAQVHKPSLLGCFTIRYRRPRWAVGQALKLPRNFPGMITKPQLNPLHFLPRRST